MTKWDSTFSVIYTFSSQSVANILTVYVLIDALVFQIILLINVENFISNIAITQFNVIRDVTVG